MEALRGLCVAVCDYSQGKLHFIVGAALLLLYLFLLLLAFVLALVAHQREVSFCFSFCVSVPFLI